MNSSTLFHLVPWNDPAREALKHPDNRRFTSLAANLKLGLEFGFHVASVPGPVIARLGRQGDLILRGSSVSAVHIAFEIQPETQFVILAVRSKSQSSVLVKPVNTGRKRFGGQGDDEADDQADDQADHQADHHAIEGDCVLFYKQIYDICIQGSSPYKFRLIWRDTTLESLKALAVRGFQDALQRQAHVRSRDLPTKVDLAAHTWYNTRIRTVQRNCFPEVDKRLRELVGCGAYGTVYKTLDQKSGYWFAIKVIHLERCPDIEYARALAHREIKTHQRLKHRNIVEFLGHGAWESNNPEIFMPLYTGTLRSIKRQTTTLRIDDDLMKTVLQQMLSALDYLAAENMCHRDVKPENILYRMEDDSVVFRLSDFSLANHMKQANTRCGTQAYEAPELYIHPGRSSQSPKMDVWSLFATIADIHPTVDFPPTHPWNYVDILLAIRAAVGHLPDLATMVREKPEDGASAAQLLMVHFEGCGLTTPRSKVPPIAPVSLSTPLTLLAPSVLSVLSALSASSASYIPTTSSASYVPSASSAASALPSPTASTRRRKSPRLIKMPRKPRESHRQNASKAQLEQLRPLGGRVTKPSAPSSSIDLRAFHAGQALVEEVVSAERRPEDRGESHQPGTSSCHMPGSFPR